jgi:hypothetical protein
MWLSTFLWIRSDLVACLENSGFELTLKDVCFEVEVRGKPFVYYPAVDKMKGSVRIIADDSNKEIIYLKTSGYVPYVRGINIEGDFSLNGVIAYDAKGRTGYIAIRRDAAVALKACVATNIALFEPSSYLFPTSRVPVLGDQTVPLDHQIMNYDQAFEDLDLANSSAKL